MLSLPAALVAMAITGSGTGETVLLDFYADWCGPCRSMMATVDQLAAQGYPVRRMNVDQYRDLSQRFGITSIPCFVMIVNGREAGRVVGPTSLGRLQQLCSLGRAAANPNTMLARAAPAASGPPTLPIVPVVFNTTPQPPPAALQSPNAAAVPLPPASDASLLAASVRLRVEDPAGHSCGSGTIIDARAGGEALILTCGHLFRDSKGTGKIEVDVFGPAPEAKVPARLLAYDLERDVGLVVFKPQGPVMVARVAPPGFPIRSGDAVTSVGCNNGEDPTVQHSHVNSLDRFVDRAAQREGAAGGAHAPWNLQVAGQPVVGRSGGGLFSTEGMVIGVCNAAEPVDREGLFAALGSIHTALDQQRIGSLYMQAIAPPALVPAMENKPGMLAAVDPFTAGRTPEPRVRIPSQEMATVAGPAAAASSLPAAATANGEPAAIDELRRRYRDGSEIVCVIRDPKHPEAKAEVITLNGGQAVRPPAAALAGQSPQDNRPRPTSLEVPKRATPILEWDKETGWKHQGTLP